MHVDSIRVVDQRVVGKSATIIAFPGGRSRSVQLWEAGLERLVAEKITGYIAEHPSPAPSVLGDDLTDWAHALRLDAAARTAEAS